MNQKGQTLPPTGTKQSIKKGSKEEKSQPTRGQRSHKLHDPFSSFIKRCLHQVVCLVWSRLTWSSRVSSRQIIRPEQARSPVIDPNPRSKSRPRPQKTRPNKPKNPNHSSNHISSSTETTKTSTIIPTNKIRFHVRKSLVLSRYSRACELRANQPTNQPAATGIASIPLT